MSPDEVFVLIVCSAIGLVTMVMWFGPIVSVSHLAPGRRGRILLAMTPVVCAALFLAVLHFWAAKDVRNDPVYLGFYVVVDVAWLGLSTRLVPLFGLSARDDVVERGNRAATWAVTGALVGVTASIAGGNIGGGPDWWADVISSFLATATLFALWFCLECLTSISENITVGRDDASGVRLAGFLSAAGLVLGRGVAGTWISFGTTVTDFVRVGWPAIILLAVAVVVERLARPTRDRPIVPVIRCGALPAMGYLIAASTYLVWLGWWK